MDEPLDFLLKRRIAVFRPKIEGFRLRIDTLPARIEGFTVRIETSHARISGFAVRIDTLHGRISGFAVRIETLHGRIGGFTRRIESWESLCVSTRAVATDQEIPLDLLMVRPDPVATAPGTDTGVISD